LPLESFFREYNLYFLPLIFRITKLRSGSSKPPGSNPPGSNPPAKIGRLRAGKRYDTPTCASRY
jgi:hypothetical protein